MRYYTLLLLPLTQLPDTLLAFLGARLEEAFENIDVLVNSSVILPPMAAYDWNRAQYRSEVIIEWLARLRRKLNVEYLLGLGYLDAYANELNFVFGEAFPAEHVAAVYLKRLDPSFYGEEFDLQLFQTRVLKEAFHELGHVFGLTHCSNKRCVMSFSNSILDVDAKTWKYCARCAELLRMSGIMVTPQYILQDMETA